MQTHEIIIALAPVFLMIFLGWFTRYFLFSESIKWRLIEKVTYYLFVPALVIKHLLYVDLENIQITNALLTLLSTIFTVILILLFSCKTKGRIIWMKNSFLFLVFSIIFIS